MFRNAVAGIDDTVTFYFVSSASSTLNAGRPEGITLKVYNAYTRQYNTFLSTSDVLQDNFYRRASTRLYFDPPPPPPSFWHAREGMFVHIFFENNFISRFLVRAPDSTCIIPVDI